MAPLISPRFSQIAQARKKFENLFNRLLSEIYKFEICDEVDGIALYICHYTELLRVTNLAYRFRSVVGNPKFLTLLTSGTRQDYHQEDYCKELIEKIEECANQLDQFEIPRLSRIANTLHSVSACLFILGDIQAEFKVLGETLIKSVQDGKPPLQELSNIQNKLKSLSLELNEINPFLPRGLKRIAKRFKTTCKRANGFLEKFIKSTQKTTSRGEDLNSHEKSRAVLVQIIRAVIPQLNRSEHYFISGITETKRVWDDLLLRI